MTQPNQVSASSDFDYLKYFEGDALISTGTGGSDTTFPSNPGFGGEPAGVLVVPHTFGRVPIVRCFWDPAKNGLWYNSQAVLSAAALDPRVSILATTSDVTFILSSDAAKSNIPVYYRIYDIGTKALSSDDLIDKIFEKDGGSASVPSRVSPVEAGQTVVPIPHEQGEDILWTVQFSEDGNDWYPEAVRIVGGPDTTSGPPGGPYSRYFETTAFGRADSTNLYIVLQNGYTTSKTLYYRYTLDYKI